MFENRNNVDICVDMHASEWSDVCECTHMHFCNWMWALGNGMWSKIIFFSKIHRIKSIAYVAMGSRNTTYDRHGKWHIYPTLFSILHN